MTIQELGSLGELIAAIATVVTLAYLALQIRRSNVVASADAQRVASSTPAAIAIAQDEGLANIFARGLQDRASLNPEETVRFDLIFGNLMASHSTSVVDQMNFGSYRTDAVADQRWNVRLLLSTPGGGAWWSLYRESFPPLFQRFVDEVRQGPSPAAF